MSWRIVISDLLPRMGSARTVEISGPVADLVAQTTRVGPDVAVAVRIHLERIPDGLVARGPISTHFESECARCLQPLGGPLEVHVDELFEPAPLEGETYLLDHDHIDLEPLVRDAILLDLPRAPLCKKDCAGLCPRCGIDRNTDTCSCPTSEPDPRWDALNELNDLLPDA